MYCCLCRLQYGSVPLYGEMARRNAADNAELPEHKHPLASLPGVFAGDYAQDDALSTIMQWLYARMESVRRDTTTRDGGSSGLKR